eukprot:CAMPEP_0202344492 /NCGR_PEP_ID=MMETSP1126-20121109/4150_1 /ASSEMBLY_ACC=CAM_ASM_000457 /TAXON_ID=3047 /ORGANISM="Dunaliella tertiolecta, Strain CCMP1320" /LENGTH=812 /DNA_ID=CAMNT_0048935689 /DNA_START=134 /DNA_END=2572 /DNA_ORIENTATION=+
MRDYIPPLGSLSVPPIDDECIICMAAPIEKGFLHGPDLHFCVCGACASKVDIGMPCPLCRAPVERVINVFSVAPPKPVAPSTTHPLKQQPSGITAPALATAEATESPASAPAPVPTLPATPALTSSITPATAAAVQPPLQQHLLQHTHPSSFSPNALPSKAFSPISIPIPQPVSSPPPSLNLTQPARDIPIPQPLPPASLPPKLPRDTLSSQPAHQLADIFPPDLDIPIPQPSHQLSGTLPSGLDAHASQLPAGTLTQDLDNPVPIPIPSPLPVPSASLSHSTPDVTRPQPTPPPASLSPVTPRKPLTDPALIRQAVQQQRLIKQQQQEHEHKLRLEQELKLQQQQELERKQQQQLQKQQELERKQQQKQQEELERKRRQQQQQQEELERKQQEALQHQQQQELQRERQQREWLQHQELLRQQRQIAAELEEENALIAAQQEQKRAQEREERSRRRLQRLQEQQRLELEREQHRQKQEQQRRRQQEQQLQQQQQHKALKEHSNQQQPRRGGQAQQQRKQQEVSAGGQGFLWGLLVTLLLLPLQALVQQVAQFVDSAMNAGQPMCSAPKSNWLGLNHHHHQQQQQQLHKQGLHAPPHRPGAKAKGQQQPHQKSSGQKRRRSILFTCHFWLKRAKVHAFANAQSYFWGLGAAYFALFTLLLVLAFVFQAVQPRKSTSVAIEDTFLGAFTRGFCSNWRDLWGIISTSKAFFAVARSVFVNYMRFIVGPSWAHRMAGLVFSKRAIFFLAALGLYKAYTLAPHERWSALLLPSVMECVCFNLLTLFLTDMYWFVGICLVALALLLLYVVLKRVSQSD